MPAAKIYTLQVSPGNTYPIFVHGFANNEAVVFSAVYYPDSQFSFLNINLVQGEVYRHVDGTVARQVYIQTSAQNPNCPPCGGTVDLAILHDFF